MDVEELVDGDLGVEGGGVEFGVAEELLNEADVGSVFEHVGGAGVAEKVTGTAPRNGLVDERPPHSRSTRPSTSCQSSGLRRREAESL